MTEDRKQHDRDGPEPDSLSPRGQGFLSRWSRRKREAAATEQPAKIDTQVDENVIAKTPARDTVERANEKTDADMPPIETLDENSDYTPFLSPKVSEKLRRVALRKLFHMAGYNIRDGLDDYDDDFTVFEPLGNTITADMRYHMEREREKERQRLSKLSEDESTEEEGLTKRSDDEPEPAKLASTDSDVSEDESTMDSEPDDDGDDGDDSPHASGKKA